MKKPNARQAPAGMAGLVRYFDEEKSIIKLSPEHVVLLCGAVILIELILMIVI